MKPTEGTPVVAEPLISAVRALWHLEQHAVLSTGPAAVFLRDSEFRFSTTELAKSMVWPGSRQDILALLRFIPGAQSCTPLKVGITGSPLRQSVRYYKIPVVLL